MRTFTMAKGINMALLINMAMVSVNPEPGN